jgi:hypothetical protein
MISYEQLLNANVKDLPSKTLTDAWYDGTKHMCDFSRDVMLRLLKQLINPSAQEIAVRDTYYRICLYLRSIVSLNRLDDVQSVASATRSIFELWIELEMLARDITGEAVQKHNSFAELQRYKHAEQIVQFADAHPDFQKMDVSPQRAFCSDSQRRLKLAREWGTNSSGKLQFTDHWSRKNLRHRSRDIGLEDTYIEVQPLLSWYVHAGSAGTAGMTKVGLEAVFALSHILTQRFFVRATTTCGKVAKVSELPEFASWIQEMLLKSGRIIVSEQIKKLEEKQ